MTYSSMLTHSNPLLRDLKLLNYLIHILFNYSHLYMIVSITLLLVISVIILGMFLTFISSTLDRPHDMTYFLKGDILPNMELDQFNTLVQNYGIVSQLN